MPCPWERRRRRSTRQRTGRGRDGKSRAPERESWTEWTLENAGQAESSWLLNSEQLYVCEGRDPEIVRASLHMAEGRAKPRAVMGR